MTTQQLLEPEQLADPETLDALLDLTAVDLLRAGADRGGSLLIVGESDTPTGGLVDAAEARARWLVASGFGHGDRIVLWLPSCRELVVWAWAAMFAGGSALPVSTRSPDAEVRRFAEIAGARLIIASKRADGMLGVEEVAAQLGGTRGVELPTPGSDDEAACFTTSGSTGASKLSVMTHRGFVAQLVAYQALIGGGPGEAVMHPMPLAHVASVAQVYLMLVQGRRVVVLPEFDARAVVQVSRDEHVSFISGTPAMWGLVLERNTLPDAGLRLRRLCYAAAPMAPRWVDGLMKVMNCELVHAYGLTEAGTLTGLPPEKVIEKAGSAGNVIAPRTELAILDPVSGARVAADAIGEVCVRGPGASPGYVGMAGETAELWRGGWLHTGDLGRLDADGDLWITGRIRDQINRGGLKIGAREVEEAIESLDGVVAAGVVGVPDSVLGERVGAVVEISDPRLDADVIRVAVAKLLADYKVPNPVLCVTELPRNAMRKIDKPALRALLRSASER